MSYLARLKKIESEKNFNNSSVSELTKPTKDTSVSYGSATQPVIEKNLLLIQSWLFHISEPESDHYLVLNKCRRDPEALAYYLERVAESQREERRKKVLAMLADKPETQRAFTTDMDSDPDNVILTIAISDQYSFEMQIPKHRYDGLALLELIHNLDNSIEVTH